MHASALLLPAQTAPAAVVLDDELETARFTRRLPDVQGQAVAESALRISGMHCAACAGTVEKALLAVPGVILAQVSAASQSATVQWQPAYTRPSAWVAAIEAAGYGAVPDTLAATRLARRQESRQALWRLFVAVFCAMQVMMMAAPAYFSSHSGSGSEMTADMKRLMDWGGWLLTLPVLVFSAEPFFSGAWRALRSRHIGMDVPVAMGLLVAFVASTGAAFSPGGVMGHEVYFDSITMFVSFLLKGRYLEMRARHQAEVALEDTVGRLPETALREAADGGVTAISVQRVQRGDVLRVPVGQAFCADGQVSLGSTCVDESLLTGESAPVEKNLGDKVVAGSLNLLAPVSMRVEGVGADTRYEAIVGLMRQARSQKPMAVMGADKWAAPFLWSVLALAALAAAVWSLIDPSRMVGVAVSVLIVTCPCALSLAAPSALLSASSVMAKQGVLLRRIDAALGLAQMQILFLDKTGTLTEAQNQKVAMSRETAQPEFGDAQLQHVASSLAAWSSHPLAKMIVFTGGPQINWRDLQELPGQGMQGRDEQGALWRLGKGATATPQGRNSHDVQTWLSRDGQTLASFHFAEVLRAGAAQAVQALQQDGVQVELLSGDSPARVQHVAQLLGLHDAHGGMSPNDKLAAVRAAQALRQTVAMIGDGINDAPVLAQADVSLAMAAGAQIARTQADGVLLSNALGDVVRARALGKKTLRVIHQNFLWAGLYNAACVPLALLGYLPPWAAGLGMAVSSLVVVGNSMRLAR
jgi:P-type Cu2+ transporter